MSDLRQTTGRGVRVAIVDTGITPDHPHVGPVAGGFGVEGEAPEFRCVADWRDRHGHGTACAGVVRWIAPDAEIFAVRVLDRHLGASAGALECALSRLAEMRIAIANLSMGGTRDAVSATLVRATRRLVAAGTLIAAAVRPDGSISWPADQPGVIAVGTDPALVGWEYREGNREGIDFVAPATPRPLPGCPPAANYSGPSFAAPRIAALAARVLEAQPSLDARRVAAVLIENASRFRKAPEATGGSI